MIDLQGKVCLVTDGAGELGAAIVEELLRAGSAVIVHVPASEADRPDTHTAREAQVLRVAADLASPQGAFGLFREALAWRGRLDVLVNNATVLPSASLDDPEEAWHRAWAHSLQVNLMAAADLSREAIKHFRSRQGGVIVNISSRAAFRGDVLEYMHYAAAKAGLVALTRSIARNCAREGVLAYAVAPGYVDTAAARKNLERVGAETILRDLPLGELVPPREVAQVVTFLSSGLARHATGTTVDVNGASHVR